MIQKTLTSFDLKQIADSGQCFRMLPAEEANTYTVISGPHFLKAAQDGQTVTFFCEPEELPFWERYFDLDTDYDAFRKAINPRDAYLKQAADFGQGVRILRQDLWEMIITFIISQPPPSRGFKPCIRKPPSRSRHILLLPVAGTALCRFSGGSACHEAGLPGQIYQTGLRGRMQRTAGSFLSWIPVLRRLHGLSHRL